MADQPLSQFEKNFIARTRAARMFHFETQQDICDVLDIDQGKYKHYETKRCIPLELIPRFAKACGVTLDWLIMGQGKGPAVQPLPAPRQRGAKVRKRVAA